MSAYCAPVLRCRRWTNVGPMRLTISLAIWVATIWGCSWWLRTSSENPSTSVCGKALYASLAMCGSRAIQESISTSFSSPLA
ncbi:hypothetical protein D3C80_1949950 [compost metagenome]